MKRKLLLILLVQVLSLTFGTFALPNKIHAACANAFSDGFASLNTAIWQTNNTGIPDATVSGGKLVIDVTGFDASASSAETQTISTINAYNGDFRAEVTVDTMTGSIESTGYYETFITFGVDANNYHATRYSFDGVTLFADHLTVTNGVITTNGTNVNLLGNNPTTLIIVKSGTTISSYVNTTGVDVFLGSSTRLNDYLQIFIGGDVVSNAVNTTTELDAQLDNFSVSCTLVTLPSTALDISNSKLYLVIGVLALGLAVGFIYLLTRVSSVERYMMRVLRNSKSK